MLVVVALEVVDLVDALGVGVVGGNDATPQFAHSFPPFNIGCVPLLFIVLFSLRRYKLLLPL